MANRLDNVQTRGRALDAGVPTMVFYSGFPDVFNSFNMITPHFESTHHVIVCIMPDYDKKGLSRFFGHSFPSLVDGLRQTLEEAHRRGGPITVVGHDWGSYVVQRFAAAHPQMVQRMVLLDVGSGNPTNLPVVIAYQMYLGFVVFLASRIPLIGTLLGMILMGLYPWKWFGPTPHEYRMPTKPTAVRPFMCYPYVRDSVLFWNR
jgi:pimeloyl-ACP methyl ester carboxylesterase